MSKQRGKMAEAAYVCGIILCPLGVCLCAKSGFGVSMVVAPAYVLYQKVSQILPWFTFGRSEYILQGILLVILGITVRKFKWKYLLSFVTAFIYGNILDGWYLLLGSAEFTQMWQRILSCICGITVTAIAIAFFLRTYLPQEAYEMFVKDVAEEYHLSMTKVKWVFDLSFLALAIVLMLVLLGGFEWNVVGLNTVLATIFTAPLIGIFGKVLDRFFCFDSAFPAFYEKFEKLMN